MDDANAEKEPYIALIEESGLVAAYHQAAELVRDRVANGKRALPNNSFESLLDKLCKDIASHEKKETIIGTINGILVEHLDPPLTPENISTAKDSLVRALEATYPPEADKLNALIKDFESQANEKHLLKTFKAYKAEVEEIDAALSKVIDKETDLLTTLKKTDLGEYFSDRKKARAFLSDYFRFHESAGKDPDADFLIVEYCRHSRTPKRNSAGTTTLKTLRRDLETLLAEKIPDPAQRTTIISHASKGVEWYATSEVERYANSNDKFTVDLNNFPLREDIAQISPPEIAAASLVCQILAFSGHKKDNDAITQLVDKTVKAPLIVNANFRRSDFTALPLSAAAMNEQVEETKQANNFTAEEEAHIAVQRGKGVHVDTHWRDKVGRTARNPWVQGIAGAALVVAPTLLPEDKAEESKKGISFKKVFTTTAAVVSTLAGIYLLQSAIMGSSQRSR